ncbi:MAG: ribonuclease HI family protein [Candidatus Dojkabacteria bacterium]
MKAKLFSDGGSRGNPGPGAAAWFIFDQQDKLIDFGGKYLGNVTNNFAEYSALHEGLKAAKKLKVEELECFLDSELIVKQINGIYNVSNANMKELYKKVKKALENFERVTVQHIVRVQNKNADKLVNIVLDLKT